MLSAATVIAGLNYHPSRAFGRRQVTWAAHGSALIGGFTGVVVLLGYVCGFEPLWRPLAHYPAISPITAVCFILLGFAVAAMRLPVWWRGAGAIAAYITTLLLSLRFIDLAVGGHVIEALTPFGVVRATPLNGGVPIIMGIHTALGLLAIAVSVLFAFRQKIAISQSVAWLAMIPFGVSAVGYLYHLDSFLGVQAPQTLLGGLALAVAAALIAPHRGILRVLLSSWTPGKRGRFLIGMTNFVTVALGWVLAQGFKSHDPYLLAMEVVGVVTIVTVILTINTLQFDAVDRQRRTAERTLARAASVDLMTGALNRAAFTDTAERICAFADRTEQPLTVLMIDIDHFKRVNDGFGHAAGDVVLKTVAEIAAQRLRRSDVIGRLGGEEFAILLPDTPLSEATSVAEDLRQRVVAHAFGTGAIMPPHVTVSIGLAEHRKEEAYGETLKRADAALYLAKNGGRNRVVAAPGSRQWAKSATLLGNDNETPAFQQQGRR